MIARIVQSEEWTSAPTTSIDSTPSRHPVPSRETLEERPLRRLPLTPHHRQCRIFAEKLGCDRLGDVSSSVMNPDSVSVMMTTAHVSWRRTGQRSDPAFIVERHTAISQGVTVWGQFLGTHDHL
ncbi:HTH_Tnp_Tc3_2 domain-containing protein [Trichonephila clavipes]|nr:HTH_Tnp_Tc3_2 domain-containing protein [Trichonephila clavipes]